MNNKRIRNEALRLQFLTGLMNIRIFGKMGRKKIIKTSYGDVKVLEYGFDSQKTEPLFIDLHGGGFVLGSAEMDEPMCVYFREKTGIKIVSIDYPKAPQKLYPAAVNAVYEIVMHYYNNAEMFKINPLNIGIGGHSAGGNIAAVICILANEKKDIKIKYQVLDYPPCDLSIKPSDKPNIKGSVPPEIANLFNTCYFNNDVKLSESPYISPVYATKEMLTGLPAALFIAAGRDSLHDEGVRYKDLLIKAGVAVEFHDFSDSVHGFTYNKTPDAKEGWDIIAGFIKKQI